jgi:'Cold-shock' DNA-binding domain
LKTFGEFRSAVKPTSQSFLNQRLTAFGLRSATRDTAPNSANNSAISDSKLYVSPSIGVDSRHDADSTFGRAGPWNVELVPRRACSESEPLAVLHSGFRGARCPHHAGERFWIPGIGFYMPERITGTVKFFRVEQDYGFIASDVDGMEVFVRRCWNGKFCLNNKWKTSCGDKWW